jgi:hypothetical protein
MGGPAQLGSTASPREINMRPPKPKKKAAPRPVARRGSPKNLFEAIRALRGLEIVRQDEPIRDIDFSSDLY